MLTLLSLSQGYRVINANIYNYCRLTDLYKLHDIYIFDKSSSRTVDFSI